MFSSSARAAGSAFVAVSMLFLSLGSAEASDSAPTATPGQAISLADYRTELQSLDALVAHCQGSITAANCQSSPVGPDITVTLGPNNAEKRAIRFGWLRFLLDEAAKSTAPAVKAPTKPADEDSEADQSAQTGQTDPKAALPQRTLAQRLADARQRLAEDSQLAESIASKPTPAPAAATQRKTLAQILAQKEYHPATRQPTLMSRILEKLGNWINRAISKLAAQGSKSRWIGLTAEIGFVVLLCVGLVWLLIRLERQGRIGMTMIRPAAAEGAASARDWQLWLADARQAASSGDWREAIHLTYWASISRLEGSGLWPADRARTPREYLALLAETSEQRADLTLLTRSFERTWYAGRPAAESDFRQAEQLAGKLGAR